MALTVLLLGKIHLIDIKWDFTHNNHLINLKYCLFEDKLTE